MAAENEEAREQTKKDLDLVVVGTGPGGYVAAIRARQLGMRVVVVEKDPQFGGTCLHRGCIPTKALLHSAAVLEEVRRANDFGIEAGPARFDVLKAKTYRRSVIERNARGIEHLFQKNRVETRRGFGRILGPGQVLVEGERGTETLQSRFVLVATGSVPKELAIARTDGVRTLNSDHILELSRVPTSLVVLGAGAVGVEFASIYASLGTQVTLVEMLPRILPLEDADVSKELRRVFRKREIEVMTEARVERVNHSDQGVRLLLAEGSPVRSLESDVLLVAVGRTPALAGIGLELAGVAIDDGFVRVNEFMQTTVSGIYAIGDVVKTPWLAHVASAEGILAVEHMAGRAGQPINYDLVPSCTYCEPEVASVGLTEAVARERGHDVAAGRFPFSASGKAAILGRTEGFVKVVRDKKYDELLGIHIVGPQATDLIAEACVALKVEATTEELFRTIHAHPSLSEAVAEAALAAAGRAVHG